MAPDQPRSPGAPRPRVAAAARPAPAPGDPAAPPLSLLSDTEARHLADTLSPAPDAALLDLLLTDYRLLRQMLDRATVGIAVLDTELRYRYVNRALAAINGVGAEQHIGRRIAEVVPGINVAAAEQALRAVLTDGEPRLHTVEGTTAADSGAESRWWHNAYHRLDDPAAPAGGPAEPVGLVAVVLEITEDRRIRQSLDRARTRLALLDEAATRITTTLDAQQAAKELARLLVPRLADLAAVDVLEPAPHDSGELTMRRLALSTTAELVQAGRYVGSAGALLRPQAGSAAVRCLADQGPIVFNHPTDEEIRALATSSQRLTWYRRLGLHSAVFVPLAAGGTAIGVVSLARSGSSPEFTPDEVGLIAELADRAGSGINNAQRYTHEHETALALQRALLAEPMTPHRNIDCALRYLPAGATAEVGGDWYDTVALPGGRTLLVVGDVMGHGLDAAAAMSEYRSLVRSLALQRRSPAGILNEAERILDALAPERVATCVLALVDPGQLHATFASAGHLPPVHLRADGTVQLLDLPIGPPLGAGVGGYEQLTLPFDAGASLLLYTDGLIERRGTDIEDSLAALRGLPLDPAAPLEHLIDTALTGLAAGHGEDDVAVLAARLAR
ncbi:SpoIIE family protein phosphatase [Kitasatospora sp. NPDC058965]|uniref:SpoIIE family protein phosphatase n=1 Tax=Kitasatospora sp. NPDC058965 TaxID=3346682 RepID=UPI0036A7D7B6